MSYHDLICSDSCATRRVHLFRSRHFRCQPRHSSIFAVAYADYATIVVVCRRCLPPLPRWFRRSCRCLPDIYDYDFRRGVYTMMLIACSFPSTTLPQCYIKRGSLMLPFVHCWMPAYANIVRYACVTATHATQQGSVVAAIRYVIFLECSVVTIRVAHISFAPCYHVCRLLLRCCPVICRYSFIM